jgi:hypothetical protein
MVAATLARQLAMKLVIAAAATTALERCRARQRTPQSARPTPLGVAS